MSAEAIGILGIVVTVAAMAVSAMEIKSRRAPKRSKVVPPIRKWSKQVFETALDYLDSYTIMASELRSVQNSDPTRRLDSRVLYEWGIALMLTAASQIGPNSQGKSTLFVLHESEPQGFRILPKYFDGPFLLDQLLNQADYEFNKDTGKLKFSSAPPPKYRRWPTIPYEGEGPTKFIAGRVVLEPHVEFDKVQTVAEVESDLGTTHILAIPLKKEGTDFRALPLNQPVVITTDFWFPSLLQAPLSALLRGPRRSKKPLKVRGRILQQKARNFLAVFPITSVTDHTGDAATSQPSGS